MSIAEMNEKEFTSYFTEVFKRNGLSGLLSKSSVESFFKLTEIMLTENEKYNLTAITEPKKIILNHYADCAALAKRLPKGAGICDVRCGAGVPTLAVAILRPDLKILGVDATAKRVAYVEMVARELMLENVSTLTARAEDMGQNPLYREKFDVVTARAVANMRVLSELCIPLCKIGGSFIAMKGKNAEGELAEARRAIPTLNGKLQETESITLTSPDEELSHPLIVIKKIAKCPAAYPRPYAKILKKPL